MSTSLRPPASTDAQRSVFGRRRPGSRLERSRAAAGLVVVCVMALGLTACSLKDAKAEATRAEDEVGQVVRRAEILRERLSSGTARAPFLFATQGGIAPLGRRDGKR